jgi:hypothetical protein
MSVTLATVVNFSAGIYATIVMADATVTTTPGHPIVLMARRVPRRCIQTRYRRMKNAPKMPRQKRIVHALAAIRRVKNPVVLNASADTVKRTTPSRRAVGRSLIAECFAAATDIWGPWTARFAAVSPVSLAAPECLFTRVKRDIEGLPGLKAG